MVKRQRKPTPPGEILREEFLSPMGLSQKELAVHIRCDYRLLNRIVNEKATVTPEIAIKLGLALETTPTFWLNAQMAVDLWRAKKPRGRIPSLLRSTSHERAA